MKVLKFGGSSVGTPEAVLKVKQIVDRLDTSAIVVGSALGGVPARPTSLRARPASISLPSSTLTRSKRISTNQNKTKGLR